ncbi:MAG: DUF3501 family protein [Chloroflexi bacterium]|nr:DUF3501 family protein [Chloroflexota bacterium]
MKPLTAADIIDIARYESERVELRKRVIEVKRHRRVEVGDIVTLVFENRDTMCFQIQEIMRAERIVMESRIAEEIESYNELIPGPGQLSATLLIEITDQAHLRQILDRLIGIDRGGTTFLQIGDERVEAEFEGGHSNEAQVSAVHFIRFSLTPEQARGLAPGGPRVALVIDHPNYQAERELADDVRASLAEDFDN